MNPYILTHTGIHFDLVDPQPDMIDERDIAHALAHLCRFTGHTSRFHSVAEHSMGVAHHVDGKHKLEALLHDASEAYLGDVSLPLKSLLPDYRKIEDRVDAVIRERFGLPSAKSVEVKHADLRMLAIERDVLMPLDPTPWPVLAGVMPGSRWYVGILPATDAEACFRHQLQAAMFGDQAPAKKALRITKCSDSMMWYARKVGQIVPLVRTLNDCYLSREDAGFTNIVRLDDAQVVEVAA